MGPPFTLIVFARQPHFGVGKTRLAERIGKWAAWQFQCRQVCKFQKLAQDPRWRLRFAWEHTQGNGDLSHRLNRALAKPGLVIGGDTLGLKAVHIARAFQALKKRPYVLGPSPDGGFWCIGARLPLRLGKVRWSTEHALEDAYGHLRKVAFTECLQDLD